MIPLKTTTLSMESLALAASETEHGYLTVPTTVSLTLTDSVIAPTATIVADVASVAVLASVMLRRKSAIPTNVAVATAGSEIERRNTAVAVVESPAVVGSVIENVTSLFVESVADASSLIDALVVVTPETFSAAVPDSDSDALVTRILELVSVAVLVNYDVNTSSLSSASKG